MGMQDKMKLRGECTRLEGYFNNAPDLGQLGGKIKEHLSKLNTIVQESDKLTEDVVCEDVSRIIACYDFCSQATDEVKFAQAFLEMLNDERNNRYEDEHGNEVKYAEARHLGVAIEQLDGRDVVDSAMVIEVEAQQRQQGPGPGPS